MSKKILALLLCLSLFMLAACSKKTERLSVDEGEEPQSSVSEPVLHINPLTGLSDLADGKTDDRPVAIMINNITTAQPVQAGLNQADIIYETEVEGGITRLLAVYQDVSKAGTIGTIRSARYAYVDLAMGHNAIYLHHGQDDTYCGPHLKDTDDINISEDNYGFRLNNGLASWHTLYTDGEKLWDGLVKDKVKTERGTSAVWASFADEDTSITLENTASAVTVPFSSSYKSVFKYDAATGVYTRYFKDTLRKDYKTGETTEVKNVFVLLTSISNYPDGKHRNIALESGDGYYCSNGTYTAIKWSKGASTNGFKFTKADGSELTVNAGSSWVCIADKNTSKPAFE
ncbi:MAG: DUF3048 domain-containing protein [Acutalibacteraceae bacterium]|nr:DUF3048 domain-containing protein [Acutalibacteraceae bacterium]